MGIEFLTVDSISSVYYLDGNSVLGEGSYGTVYKATKLDTHNVVALKKISKDMIRKQHIKEAFENELHVMKTISHPMIVRTIDFVQTKHDYFIAQELCEGGDLES